LPEGHSADQSIPTVDFETFQRVLNRQGGFREPGAPEEYTRGFQVFDKDGTGYIGVGQLKYILTNLGEKMSEEEVEELLKAVDTSSGQVNYTGMSYTLPSSVIASPMLTHDAFRRTRPDYSCELTVSPSIVVC
jgi:Ca2+-binding EF-hand superfamily protein